MPAPIPAIVVVEDEPDILVILRRVLRDLETDLDIVAMTSGEEALAYAGNHPCPLLITDYMLGSINGLQLAKMFKCNFGSRVIMISAHLTPTLRSTAQGAGIDFLFSKPFKVDALEEAIRTALSQPIDR